MLQKCLQLISLQRWECCECGLCTLSPQVSLLFSLWVETVRPYLQIVDEWIVHGHLCDCAREFIIQRWLRQSQVHGCRRHLLSCVRITWVHLSRRHQVPALKYIFPSLCRFTAFLCKSHFWVIVCSGRAGLVKRTLLFIQWVQVTTSRRQSFQYKSSVRQKYHNITELASNIFISPN